MNIYDVTFDFFRSLCTVIIRTEYVLLWENRLAFPDKRISCWGTRDRSCGKKPTESRQRSSGRVDNIIVRANDITSMTVTKANDITSLSAKNRHNIIMRPKPTTSRHQPPKRTISHQPPKKWHHIIDRPPKKTSYHWLPQKTTSHHWSPKNPTSHHQPPKQASRTNPTRTRIMPDARRT